MADRQDRAPGKLAFAADRGAAVSANSAIGLTSCGFFWSKSELGLAAQA